MGTKDRRPCGTPGAVYETELVSDRVVMTILLPVPALDDLSEGERQEMIWALHKGVLPAMERFYSRIWKDHFAGVPDDDGKPFPATHQELFANR